MAELAASQSAWSGHSTAAAVSSAAAGKGTGQGHSLYWKGNRITRTHIYVFVRTWRRAAHRHTRTRARVCTARAARFPLRARSAYTYIVCAVRTPRACARARTAARCAAAANTYMYICVWLSPFPLWHRTAAPVPALHLSPAVHLMTMLY